MADSKQPDHAHVPAGLNLKTRLFASTAGLWRRLANIETAVLRDELSKIDIEKPIYVTGVPRAGTTITTEMLERHPDVTSHRYSDFPNIYTPFWRNWLADRAGRGPARRVERSHGDRIMITPESPEAVEEVIWMQFFDHLHDPGTSQVLNEDTENPQFESFYRDHVRKLLLVRQASRYLAKGNYNVTRLRYIQKLFPDARFVFVVRNPVNQVASLVKQDRLFKRNSAEDARVPRQLALSGHFEFGPEKRCINLGNAELAREIHALWDAGDDVHAWALYWNAVYSHVLDAIEGDTALRSAVHFVRFEELCRHPGTTIDDLTRHCDLPLAPFKSIRDEYIGRLSEPDYYEPDFDEIEMEQLRVATRPAAERFGYNSHGQKAPSAISH